MGLTPFQAKHIAKIFPECRAKVARYREASAQFVISRIDCCSTAEEAAQIPRALANLKMACPAAYAVFSVPL